MENWSANPISHYCEITICEALLTSIVVLVQNGTLIGYPYVTLTWTMSPGSLHCALGAQAVQPVVPVVLAFSQVVVTVRLFAFNPGYGILCTKD